ncbi:protein translocase subunit SecF [Romeria aff. gracilis LEGE 07310]|uniref:Protein-export membrane protein SecF n=1 Tax=Vasconcelosia minhoensis LEGE 07310 TaxID=915328 RepID=A0A8J7DRP0_9CYAN|nr:protein translocase subunit SecF [Romeria gracilis]MBE9078979.1 protein translocase subunit SecF [Romeria aff. gracilis LEGE 07310]
MKLKVIQQRGLWWVISGILILIGIGSMVLSWQQFQAPIRPGLDFVGGTRLQVSLDCSVPDNCDGPIDLTEVRQVLESQNLGSSSLQLLGDDRQTLSVRAGDLDVGQRSQLQQALEAQLGQFDPAAIQIDTVGPVLGQQLFTSGLLALIVAFAGITVYLSVRFQLDYALLALVALLHDLLVTLGIFSILGLTVGFEANSLFIVALLTIVGFSVNDTVVIYDRIRENLSRTPDREMNDVVDDAVNQTLARSINTTLTTTLTLASIVLFGGESLKFFALALIVGFIAGAYSSIFIASTLLAWWRSRADRPGSPAASDPPDSSEPV